MYDELDELFDHLSDKQRIRVILKYVLKLPISQISIIENASKQALSDSIVRCKKELLLIQKQDNLVDLIQRIFAKP